MIVCEAKRGPHVRRGVISGTDVYGLTAAAVCRGAILAARPGFHNMGALAPAQAFAPKDLLKALGRFEVSWQLSETDVPEPVGT